MELLQGQEHMQGDIDTEMMHVRGIHSMLHTGGAFWWTKLSSCSYNEGLHSYVEKAGLEDELIVRNALVDMYGKCGCIESAHRLFCLMREKDLHSWRPMISGLSCHGRGEEVVGLFFSSDFRAACSHAGLVDEGCISSIPWRVSTMFPRTPSTVVAWWNFFQQSRACSPCLCIH